MSGFKKYFHNKINEDEADGGEKSYDKEKIFAAIIDLFKENPKILEYLENIINETIVINNLNDITEAFDKDFNSNFGKTVLVWNK